MSSLGKFCCSYEKIYTQNYISFKTCCWWQKVDRKNNGGNNFWNNVADVWWWNVMAASLRVPVVQYWSGCALMRAHTDTHTNRHTHTHTHKHSHSQTHTHTPRPLILMFATFVLLFQFVLMIPIIRRNIECNLITCWDGCEMPTVTQTPKYMHTNRYPLTKTQRQTPK